MIMSLADFDDVFKICCDWETEVLFQDVIMTGLNGQSSDLLTYQLTSRMNRLEATDEKDLLNLKREGVLI